MNNSLTEQEEAHRKAQEKAFGTSFIEKDADTDMSLKISARGIEKEIQMFRLPEGSTPIIAPKMPIDAYAPIPLLRDASSSCATTFAPTRKSLLDEACVAVTKDRDATHGAPEDSFGKIAKLWSAHLGIDITPAQVTLLLVELKTARAWGNPEHKDNWVDIAGYSACGGELAMKKD